MVSEQVFGQDSWGSRSEAEVLIGAAGRKNREKVMESRTLRVQGDVGVSILGRRNRCTEKKRHV